jgi:hypothetical protein
VHKQGLMKSVGLSLSKHILHDSESLSDIKKCLLIVDFNSSYLKYKQGECQVVGGRVERVMRRMDGMGE